MKFNCELKPEELGFDDALELVGNLKHIVYLKRYQREGDHLLLDARHVKPGIFYFITSN